jgi:nucleotide-binding universal stress UspA family protein
MAVHMDQPYVVVVGTDYSEHAARALHVALEQGRRHRPAELHVVHAALTIGNEAAFPLDPLTGLGPVPILSAEEQQAALLAHLDEQLAHLPIDETAGLKVYAHLLFEAPGFALTCLASELEADLLVVGSHGRHGLARWLLGSVAEAVVRQASCPVLVVPPPSDTFKVPAIVAACPRCVAARTASAGRELWCAEHRQRHGRRHTYYQRDRNAAETNLPLVVRA